MERGYIKIEENHAGGLTVAANIENGTLWMTKYEIAYLFNMNVISIGNTINAIFKCGVLREENVTKSHQFKLNGKASQAVMYNLEVIIHIGFRISSAEGEVFRKWVVQSFIEYQTMRTIQFINVAVKPSDDSKISYIISLN